MKTKHKTLILSIPVFVLLMFASCVHAPVPVSRQVSSEDDSFTDASEMSDIAFWKNVELQYYRNNEPVYMEWGKIFADESENGRILVYSPDKDRIDTRSYVFEDAELDPQDDYSMEALLGPALLKGWIYQGSEFKKPDTIIVKAVAETDENAPIFREPDYEAVSFFMNMLLVFFEVWIDLVLD
jgi:hypothetical protein